eukprot:TRINITY_DN38265_c0_g1_i1.p1 TRINITY_DN38265_c0_g1~~TRINITY_DN38265_c0_g1_i1.p1  ORF type:complete len:1313 (-),score=190.96 TRINITY_DN38265_c0_g1_i1:108-4046(-)
MAESTGKGDAKLLASARLVEEALTQDELHLRLDEVCPGPSAGSANYDCGGQPRFEVSHVANSLPAPFLSAGPLHCGGGGNKDDGGFTRHGVLPDIERMWRSVDNQLILWKYTDPRAPDVMSYHGVTQQIVAAETARPKSFVSGVAYFLILSTPVDVSLHAVRFAAGSDKMLPLVRTQHVVATDDVTVGALACDDSTGRIFLGGTDGCIHELQYFDQDEVGWLGRKRKCSRSVVHWNMMSRLPTLLSRVTRKILGTTVSETVVQLVADGSRGLLYSLSSCSSVTVHQIPASRRDANGRLEEPPLTQICVVSANQLAGEVARVRSHLFPGLAAPRTHFFTGGAMAAASAAMRGRSLRIVKLVRVEKSQGGDITLCAVVADGTRIFFRGAFQQRHGIRPPGAGFAGSVIGSAGAGSWVERGGAASSSSNATASGVGQPTMTGLITHHIRFLDTTMPAIQVRDVILGDGVTLMVARASDGYMPQQPLARFGVSSHTSLNSGGDVIVAISTDLRAVAQRQSTSRSPWLPPSQGLAEHAEIIQIRVDGVAGACQAIALAAFSCQLPRALHFLYSSEKAVGQPVLKLSELARQQLVPPLRFLLVSSLGAHVITKRRPMDIFRQHLGSGDLPLIRDFALEYTSEQSCALCFQLLTTAVVPTLGNSTAQRSSEDMGHLSAFGVSSESLGVSSSSSALTGFPHSLPHAISAGGDVTSAKGRLGMRDETEEQTLLRAEHLLLHPQMSKDVGFLQAFSSLETRGSEPLHSPLGHAIQSTGGQRISGRLRGLCLYLSRIVRPLWLAPVMHVSWPPRASVDGNRAKRKRDEWWPPPPEPPPSVEGSQWRCSWSRAQRSHIREQVARLHVVLGRCSSYLAGDGAKPGGTGLSEADLVAGVTSLVATALEALEFLELISARTDSLTVASLSPETLVQFAEITFRDLVCQPEARRVLQRLMQGGVVECHQLHNRCPRLFSAADLQLQEALELLDAAQKGLVAAKAGGVLGIASMDQVRISHLVQRALQSLETHASRVDLVDVASRLGAVGAFRGLIGLCVRAAAARDPGNEALRPKDPTSTKAQQLYSARVECYQIILELFEELLAGMRQQQAIAGETPVFFGVDGAGLGASASEASSKFELPDLLPVPIELSAAAVALDRFLRHCLEGKQCSADELFHFCILKWMMDRSLPVYRYKSKFLSSFLEGHAADKPELLCRYYQQNGDWSRACDAYLALAQGRGGGGLRGGSSSSAPQLTIDDKIVLLQSAALCAQMPGSGRRAEPIRQAMAELSQMKSQQQNGFLGARLAASTSCTDGDGNRSEGAVARSS